MDIKIVSLFIACFLSMVVAQEQRGRDGQGGRGGHGGRGSRGGSGGRGGSDNEGGSRSEGRNGRGGPRRPPPSMLPDCKEYMEELHKVVAEMRQNGEGGPDNCQSENPHDCMFEDMMAAKTRENIVPSERCETQAQKFFGRRRTESESG